MENFLIEAEELLKNYDPCKTLVIDARTKPEYEKSHLPGAVFLTTYGCFVPDTTDQGLAQFASEVGQLYRAIGVDCDRPVVVYENETGMRAARELWILKWLGHRNVRMLHGGIQAWKQASGEVVIDSVTPVPGNFVPQMHPEMVISAREIYESLGTQKLKIVDVRDTYEYRGLDHTECCERRGHVPGAQWIEWTEFIEAGRYKSPEEIQKILTAHGISIHDVIVPYCHRGARSASAYFAFKLAGCDKVRNFIGSMHEWSATKDLPIEV